MSSSPSAPHPVFAKRREVPQYLAPGQHLKVASRKPAPKRDDAPPPGPPRDPWESLDECPDDEPQPTPPRRSGSAPHGHRDGASTGGGGHPFAQRLSVSTHSTDDAPPSPPQPQQPGEASHEDEGEGGSEAKNGYYTSSAMPEVSAAERAQRVLDAQHRALEAKQLQTLTQQGVARRPKTLLRSRHGRLNAIPSLLSSSGPEEAGPTLRITDTPASPGEHPDKVKVRVRVPKPKSAAASRKKAGAGPASSPKRREEEELVDSRPGTPPQRMPEQLDIDLD